LRDVARIEAGRILIRGGYTSRKKALIDARIFTRRRIGLGQLGGFEEKKDNFVGASVARWSKNKGPERAMVWAGD